MMNWESEFFQRDRSIHPPAFTPDYKTSVLRSPRRPLLSLQNSLCADRSELRWLRPHHFRCRRLSRIPDHKARLLCVAEFRQQLAPRAHPSFGGTGFVQRLITQMYFEGDPLLAHDPMFRMIPDEAAARRLVAPIDLNGSVPLDMLAYRFDIVLRGRRSTLFENKLQGN